MASATGSEMPQKTRPFVRTMSALGRMGMGHSRSKEQLQHRLRVKMDEFAYLLVSCKLSGALRWENLPLKL
jgi:hypothetical protein